jgi:short-subunit dehydrogenase
MKVACVFGSNGGIGSAVVDSSVKHYMVVHLDRVNVDFTKSNSDQSLKDLIVHIDPDLIVNCVGYLPKDSETHNQAMDINFGSNWSLIKYYMENPPSKPVKIIMVGSSAYKQGRRNYMLYAASKAALYSLWQSCNEYFENSDVSVSLINPVRTKTRMMDPSSTRYLLPEDVADRIVSMSLNPQSECVDLGYKE